MRQVVQITCPTCQKNFEIPRTQLPYRKHCSRQCHYHYDLPPLTERQKEIIVGSLLGDGSINRGQYKRTLEHPERRLYGNAKFWKKQASFREEYLLWHLEEFGPYSFPKFERGSFTHPCTGTLCHFVKFKTHANPIFNDFHNSWYPNNIKIVPRNIKLTPLTLAIWLCDDGYNDINLGLITLCTEDFVLDDVEFLRSKLMNDLSITTNLTNHNGGRGHRILIPVISYLNTINLVKPFITWNCFQYKISVLPAHLNRTTKVRRKSWRFLNPAGEEVIVTKLRQFCAANNLSCSKMYAVSTGKASHHHGWRSADTPFQSIRPILTNTACGHLDRPHHAQGRCKECYHANYFQRTYKHRRITIL